MISPFSIYILQKRETSAVNYRTTVGKSRYHGERDDKPVCRKAADLEGAALGSLPRITGLHQRCHRQRADHDDISIPEVPALRAQHLHRQPGPRRPSDVRLHHALLAAGPGPRPPPGSE